MKVTGSTQVITQIVNPTRKANAVLRRGWDACLSLVEEPERNPPTISSTYPARTQVRSGRRLVGFSGRGDGCASSRGEWAADPRHRRAPAPRRGRGRGGGGGWGGGGGGGGPAALGGGGGGAA